MTDIGDPGAPSGTSGVQVTVRLFAAAAAELGTEETLVEATTVQEVLGALLSGAGDRARTVVGRSALLLNGVACRDTATPVSTGDRVDVLPPFAGG